MESDVKSVKVTFGRKLDGMREFEIIEAPILHARKWRKQFSETLLPLFEQAAVASDMKFDKPEDLMRLLPLVRAVALDALDEVSEMVIAYAPELEDEREWILNNGTERQAVDAFVEVLRLANPFDMTRLAARFPGLANLTTSSKSQSPSGDTGPTTSDESPSAS